MVKTTRQQRKALFRVFQRDFPSWVSPGKRQGITEITEVSTNAWRNFRRSIHPYFDKSGCVMVHWRGMWLGIETDGYTHS